MVHLPRSGLGILAQQTIKRNLTNAEYRDGLMCRSDGELVVFFQSLLRQDKEHEWLRTAPRCKPKAPKGKHHWCSRTSHRAASRKVFARYHRRFLPSWNKPTHRRPK